MNIKTIFKNAGELLIGEVINETEEYYDFADLAYVSVGAGQEQGKVQVQFVPVDMLAIQPIALPLKAIVADPSTKLTMRVYKNQILIDKVEIKAEIIANYQAARVPSSIITPDKKIVVPSGEEKVIKLFD